MRHRYATLIVLPIVAGVMTGCDREEKPVASYQQIDQDNSALVTNAASRLVMDRLPPTSGVATRLICSEPSPDIATALSTALALTGSGKAPNGVTASVGFSESTAEAITALAGRTEAVVALRDGLFKACEAYANGLIHRGAYALILSQYGDLLVTLMLAEAAATAAQKGGATTPSSDGAPSPSTQASAALKTDLAALQTALAAVAKAQGEPANSKTKSTDAQSAQTELVTAATKMAKDSAAPPTAAPPSAQTKTAAVADPVSTIYSTYYANAQVRVLQSLVVTCLEQGDSDKIPTEPVGISRATVCTSLYKALSDNMAKYLSAAYTPAK